MSADGEHARLSPVRHRSGGHLGRLALKELRETLRDRRTMVTLVLMPLLVYPLLSIAFQKLVLSSFVAESGPGAEKYLVAVPFDQDRQADELRRAVVQGGQLLGEGADLVGLLPSRDVEQSVLQREVEVGAVRRPGGAKPRGGQPDGPTPAGEVWELWYRDDAISREALEYVERRLQAYGADKLRKRVEALSGAREPLPIVVRRTELKEREKGMAFSLSALVPLILILMTITGAVYPAIDLTAGERERGTLEALIAAPVSRLGLLAAKYCAVLTVALLTAAINLTAMTVTIYSVGLGQQLFGAAGLTFRMVLEVFGLLVLFAGFFSAVLLTVTSFARSFKEAQAYLIPLMLLAIAPGLLSLNEDLKLNGPLAVAPLVNLVLLGRDLFAGNAHPLAAAMVVLSTFLFSLAALAVAARVFGTDALLYGSQGTWSEAWRGPLERQATASVATALLCVAVLFPVFYNVQGLLGQLGELAMSDRLWINALFTVLLFGVFPVGVVAWRKVWLSSGLRLREPQSFLGMIGALLLGLSLWPWVYELVMGQQSLGIGTLDPSLMKKIADMARSMHEQPLAVLLVTLAVVPAVCEELFFRGLVYQALAAKARPYQAILISAALFGAFHIFAFGALATPRLLPSTLMGLILGWVCYRTGSIWPGVVLHVCHNGAPLVVTHYLRDVDLSLSAGLHETHVPMTWLAASAVGIILGIAAVATGRAEPSRQNPMG